MLYINWAGVFETDAAASYVDRLLVAAKTTPIKDRFFLWATDDLLPDIEVRAFEDEGQALQNYLIGLYQGWRDALTDEEWAEVERRNTAHGGANQNSLLDFVV